MMIKAKMSYWEINKTKALGKSGERLLVYLSCFLTENFFPIYYWKCIYNENAEPFKDLTIYDIHPLNKL